MLYLLNFRSAYLVKYYYKQKAVKNKIKNDEKIATSIK